MLAKKLEILGGHYVSESVKSFYQYVAEGDTKHTGWFYELHSHKFSVPSDC